METTYIEEITEYLKVSEKKQEFGQHCHFINKLFFSYPSKRIGVEVLNEITQKLSTEFDVPFHDIKLIGSSHLGFSLTKWDYDNKRGKLHDKGSDIDISIINQDLFINLLLRTYKSTNAYTDNTQFKKPSFPRQFKNNIASGYIRPDMIGDNNYRTYWIRVFKELSVEYNLRISAAVYLNETFFVSRLEKALEIYNNKLKNEVGNDGTE